MKALDRSLVGCKKCGRGYPLGDMQGGLCAECWQKMRDQLRAEIAASANAFITAAEEILALQDRINAVLVDVAAAMGLDDREGAAQ